MKTLLTVLLIVSFISVETFAQKIKEYETRESLAMELYVKSGLQVQLLDSPQVIINSLDKQKELVLSNNLDSEKRSSLNKYFNNLNQIAEIVYNAQNLKKTFLDYFENELTIPESKQILFWLDSPVGLKCTKVEEVYTDTKKMNEYNSFVMELTKKPPPVKRTQIAEKFIKANDMIDRSVDLLTNMQLAQTIALVYALTPENEQALHLAKKRIEEAKPRIKMNLEQIMVSRILFIYQDLTDSEFEQYLEFLETPIGTKYTKISSDAYDVAFTRASFEFGEKVGELLQSKKGKTEI
ncbi:MAG: hypothetical protein ACR2NC_01750 [Thermodesulfobacteriota bacterium]